MYRTKCLLALLAWFVGVVHSCRPRMPVYQSIKFKIQLKQSNGKPTLTCDHSDDKILQNKYTVSEGEDLKITTEYDHIINHVICHDYTDEKLIFKYRNTTMKNVTYTLVEKIMGTLWKCMMLAHKGLTTIYPVVQYKNDSYAAAYCFMKIHVRQTNPPQTILVNNMVLPAVRTSLSEKLIDFTTEYQYADGDVVAVTCSNFINEEIPLTMNYEMAGSMSDNSIMKGLSSIKAIGFVTKMHSGHNNSYMICTYKGTTDYTKVMVRFVMRTEFQIVSIRIDGMNLRPNRYNAINNTYHIEYKYRSKQPINVVCDVERTDVQLFVGLGSGYKNAELLSENKTATSFSLQPTTADKLLACSAKYHNGTSAEQVTVHVTEGNFPVDQYPLDLKFISNSIVMELYSDYQLKIILYEFEEGETLSLICGPLQCSNPGPHLYLELKDHDKCQMNGCTVSKIMHMTRNHENTDIVCYLKEHKVAALTDIVRREIRVILKRVLTTNTTSTGLTADITTTNTTAAPAPSETSTYSSYSNDNQDILIYCVVTATIAVVIVVVVAQYFIVKKRCCVRSNPPIVAPRPHPDTVFYENLLAVFRPINEREAAEMEMENHYEEIE